MLKYHKDIECFTASLHTSHMPCICVCVWCADLVHCIFICVYASVSSIFCCVRMKRKRFWKHCNARKIFSIENKHIHTHFLAPKTMTAALWIFMVPHVCIGPRLSVFLPKFIPWPSLLSLPSSPSSSLVLSPFRFLFFCVVLFFFFSGSFHAQFLIIFFCVPFYTFYLCILQFFFSSTFFS